MQTFELFAAKNFRFFENYGESAWTGGRAVRRFFEQGGQFFVILCGRLL